MGKKLAVLVYQAGIANVFTVDKITTENVGRNATRIAQSDFRTCESYAAGMSFAGYKVTTMQCNQAGDIVNSNWSTDLEDAPFSESFRPVGRKRVQS